MPEKRILLVGDGNHQFIINLAKWLKKEEGGSILVDIFSLSQIKESNKKYYNEYFFIKKNLFKSIFDNIKGLRLFYRFLQYRLLLKKLPKYNAINFHYMVVDNLFLVNQLKKKSDTKIIISIWGSDMYRLIPKNKRYFIRACNNADKISFTNEESLQYFKKEFNWNIENLNIVRFGLAPLELLKNISKSKLESKAFLEWNVSKLAVVIGYNLSPFQQHTKILECFENPDLNSFKDKIQLILPITYGGSDEYKVQLLKKLNNLPFDFIIYDEFLTDEKVAFIRKASDVMIQLQTTDQFSGSMQEHLYTGNIVITGAWLPYQTIKKEGAWFVEINKITQLVKVLPDVLNNFKEYKKKTFKTSQAIANLSLWENNIKNWLTLYK